MTVTTDVYVPPFPHEPMPDVDPREVSSVGPTGSITTVWLACRHCCQWYPAGSDGRPVARCAHRAHREGSTS
jgi:hypothetical protein